MPTAAAIRRSAIRMHGTPQTFSARAFPSADRAGLPLTWIARPEAVIAAPPGLAGSAVSYGLAADITGIGRPYSPQIPPVGVRLTRQLE
jgi:hypothetical protein